MLGGAIKEDMNLKGKSICFTGTLSTFTREQARELIEDRGAIFSLRVTSDLDYLVYGDKVGGTKTRAAQKFGIQMRSEQWLAAAILVNQPGLVPRKSTSALKDLSLAGPPPTVKQAEVKPKGRRVRVL